MTQREQEGGREKERGMRRREGAQRGSDREILCWSRRKGDSEWECVRERETKTHRCTKNLIG